MHLSWLACACVHSYYMCTVRASILTYFLDLSFILLTQVDPALVATNGYDFRNNVNGDTYVFLWNKGGDVPAWHAARRAFNTLAGPTPLLPDYAYGTWFTWWHQYSEAEAKQDVTRWENDKLPIDIWALDMNWRQTPHGHNGQPVSPGGFGDEEHHYDYPNTELFPGLCGEGDHATCAPDAAAGSEWFDWIQSRKLRTYVPVSMYYRGVFLARDSSQF